jgi:hypothetical protein
MSNILSCQSCQCFVTSPEHFKKCTNVTMYELEESIVTPDFKPMMTYGLGGCTVLLMVFFDKYNKQPFKVVLGHHPDKDYILQWFNKIYTDYFDVVTIIKTPETFEKKDEKWITKISNEKFWNDNIRTRCKLILEPYSLYRSFDDKTCFESSLYFRMDSMPQYSNNNGDYITINYS